MTRENDRFVYETFIRTSPNKLWDALTQPEFMRRYWFGMAIESDWREGSAWKLLFEQGGVADEGEVIEIERPKRLLLKWRNVWKAELADEGETFCLFEIEPVESAVKLTVEHYSERQSSELIRAVSGGWPKILSNLKSLIETGEAILS